MAALSLSPHRTVSRLGRAASADTAQFTLHCIILYSTPTAYDTGRWVCLSRMLKLYKLHVELTATTADVRCISQQQALLCSTRTTHTHLGYIQLSHMYMYTVCIQRYTDLSSSCYAQTYRLPTQRISFRSQFHSSFYNRSPVYMKLSCRRETARSLVSLNITLSHPRSLKVIRNATFE